MMRLPKRREQTFNFVERWSQMKQILLILMDDIGQGISNEDWLKLYRLIVTQINLDQYLIQLSHSTLHN
jgi:hypothetical protein